MQQQDQKNDEEIDVEGGEIWRDKMEIKKEKTKRGA